MCEIKIDPFSIKSSTDISVLERISYPGIFNEVSSSFFGPFVIILRVVAFLNIGNDYGLIGWPFNWVS